MHSYRVFSIGEGAKPSPTAEPSSQSSDPTSKPILMCFICKLSFGFAKSFEGHCTGEHGVELSEGEREALQSDANCSAIIQGQMLPMMRCYMLQQKLYEVQNVRHANKLHSAQVSFLLYDVQEHKLIE